MAWNLSGLIIILLFLNQSITILDPDCKMSIKSKIVSAKDVFSSAKLWSEPLDRLKNIGPNTDPWGTPDIISW